MPLSDPSPIDTRPLFRPVSAALGALLKGLDAEDWSRPTIAGHWTVRDVVAHLIDVQLRRLSFHRDRLPPPPPPEPITSERDFVRFINRNNAQWVEVSRRFSPAVLTDLVTYAGEALAGWVEQLPFDTPARFPVSWAGEEQSAGWFDIGREFTELWHHQQQIRLAVGAPPLADARFLRAVVELAMRAVPHAYRDVAATPGETVAVQIDGPSGSRWTLVRDADRWVLRTGVEPQATAAVHLRDEDAWRLLFNGLSSDEAERAVRTEGDARLVTPFLRTRSVIV